MTPDPHAKSHAPPGQAPLQPGGLAPPPTPPSGVARLSESLPLGFALDILDQAIVLLDGSADAPRILYVNEAFFAITGHTADQVLGNGLDILHGPATDPAAHDRLRAAIQRGEHLRDEVIHCRADGTPFRNRVDGLPVPGPAGCHARYLLAMRDVSELRSLDKARLIAEERLNTARRLESVGLLAAGVAHDFNNLLLALGGFVEIARGEHDLPPRAEDALVQASRLVHRAGDLVRQLLACAGRGDTSLGPVDVPKLAAELAHLLGSTVGRRASIVVEAPPNLPRAHADETQIRQVLLNLLANAAEALGDHGGSIRVAAEAREVSRLELAEYLLGIERQPGRYLVLRVADDGSGMDEATRQRLFEPFFTTKPSGSGLGLPSVLGIVRAHGGALRVASQPGVGTTFDVLLPISLEGAPRQSDLGVAPRVLPGHPRGAVLLVDDDEMIRTVARKMLERLGFAVHSASNGAEAIDCFGTHAPAIRCVLLDMAMPQMDGRETLRHLRRAAPDLPVILSSGRRDPFVDEACSHRATAYLAKPYRLDCLERAIAALLTVE